MSAGANEKLGFLRQVDLLVLFGALVALFVALGSEPWWTLTGTATNSLLSVQVSPFYLHINALGLPSTVSAANNLGSFTRVLLILGSLALFAASIQPTSWWRNLAVYFGLSSLVELYLSFVLIYYWAPLVTASFYFPYYLGFVSLGLVVGRSLIKIIHQRAYQVLTALLPGGRIHDVYLSPPFQHVWFSSNDKEFNPLGKDPQVLNDDELLVSFQKLFDTVEPGGSLSIILPDWATTLGDRIEKLMPITGFEVESSGLSPDDSTSKPVMGMSFSIRSPRVVAQSGRIIERLPPGSTVSNSFWKETRSSSSLSTSGSFPSGLNSLSLLENQTCWYGGLR